MLISNTLIKKNGDKSFSSSARTLTFALSISETEISWENLYILDDRLKLECILKLFHDILPILHKPLFVLYLFKVF